MKHFLKSLNSGFATTAARQKRKEHCPGQHLQRQKIKIGDKELSPDESYDRINFVEGAVNNADEFTLGDGIEPRPLFCLTHYNFIAAIPY